MSCTILSTRSYSGHMSWQVPTGVIAWASEVGFSGSERNPFLIASFRSFSRFCLSCGHEGRPNVTRYIFVSVVVGCNTYRLIEVAHALLVGPTIFHCWITPALARRVRCFACMTLKGRGKGRWIPPRFIVVQTLIGRRFEMMRGLAHLRRVGRRSLDCLSFLASMSGWSRSKACSCISTPSATAPGTWPLRR